jgi:3-oxoadipate enol-lactonase
MGRARLVNMTSRTVRGCNIAYEYRGVGPDVVWAHGLTQSRALENVQPLIEWAGVEARVLRYDARGHGESDSTLELEGYTWEELAHDQLELTAALGTKTYVAGGASMGCATALHAAVLAPDRIGGLILVIPPTGWESRAAQSEVYEQGAEVVEAYGVEPLIKAGAVIAPPDPLADDPDYRTRRADGLRSWESDRLARAMRGAAGAQLPKRNNIAAIECPTLVLAWTGDATHPSETAEELGDLLPHAEVHIDSTADEVAAWPTLVANFLNPGRVNSDAYP